MSSYATAHPSHHQRGAAPATLPPLPREFYARGAPAVAPDLLGCVLFYRSPQGLMSGRIAETEAYLSDDPASHSFRGQSARNAAMFGSPGHAYVYRIYGFHYCLNAVTGEFGDGQAVLLRALEPLAGVELMCRHRGLSDVEQAAAEYASADERTQARIGRALCGGPGKLCQAMTLDLGLNNTDLTGSELWIGAPPGASHDPALVEASTRIGITRGVEHLWRFTLSGDPFRSRP